MRIGLLTDGYKPGINGITKFIVLHKHTLESMGHEVFVFTWGAGDPDDEPGVLRSPGLPFIKPGYHVGLGYSTQAQAVIETLDLLHANQPLFSGALALRYGRRYGLPVAFTFHSRYDLLGVAFLPIMPLSVYRAVLRRYMRWFTDRCDLVTVSSPGGAQTAQSLGVACPIEIIPCGTDLSPYGKSQHQLTRDQVGIPAAAPLALYVGRLSPEKSVSFLLQALAQPELARAYLLLAGDGADRKRLEAYARKLGVEERVRFVGEINPSDVPEYIALADLFVTASRVEMLPIAVLEALAGGLPIVGLDTPWIHNVVQHEINGLLAAQDVASLARTWASLLENGSLRARLADGARATGKQYDVRRTTALMVSHYERVVNGHVRQGEKNPYA